MTTMKDVAAKAGVGLGTVSRVINNSGSVKESTRIKVMNAVKALDYEPNEAARNFKMQKSLSVALIIPTVWHPFYSAFSYYVERELFKNKFKTIICNSRNEVDREIEYIDMLKKNKIDGIIAITYSEAIDQYVTSHLPMVSIDRHFTEDVLTITSDHFQGGCLAASELIRHGCKTIGYIGSVSKIKNESMLRKKGFIEYVEKQGITYSVKEINEPVLDIQREILSFIENTPHLDGLFCMNDKWAEKAIVACELLGKKIPEDIQIIGFDGAKMNEQAEIKHSTIVQPIQTLAQLAVKKLIQIIEGEPVEEKVIVPVTFFEGDTTKKVDE